MSASETVSTYARALYDLATVSDAFDAVDEGLKAVVRAVRGNVDLREAFLDTSVPGEKKREIMRAIFGDAVVPEVVAVAGLMVERGHTDLLGQVASEYGRLLEEKRGVVVAEVTTAVPLSDALRARLVEKLAAATGRTVSLQERVDPSILGGIVIKVAGRVLDGSVNTQLRELRQALSTARQGGDA
ncbi:f-type ATPase subunit delta [Coriobacteriaceae bacterium EMTCatB1]|nr:f-type ATPase subunit delta [Coriobacteriaceae bacterium EMTCatB1]